MLKKIIISLLAIICFMVGRACAEDKRDRALIVYDTRYKFGYDNDEVLAFKLALGHFDIDVFEVSESYYEEGYLEDFDYVFVLGLDDKELSNKVLDDLIQYKGTTILIGTGFKKALLREEFGKNIFLEKNYNAVDIYYKHFKFSFNRRFGISDNNLVDYYDVKNGQVFSYFTDGKRQIPYILNYNNRWVVTRYDSEGITFYILCDVLHNIFKKEHSEEKKVFVRIEDVHAKVDVKRLRRIGDYLKDEGIPYMIALIPAYKENGRIYRISDNRELVDTLRYMQQNGGTIVLHGYTHQIRDERTGEGYEFWDIKNSRPPSDDMNRYMEDRVYSALLECLKCKLYPLAFEAPHYAIDKEGYEFLKGHFSTYVGHIQTSQHSFCTTAYPYRIDGIEFLNKLVPENLGYVYSDNINEILKNMDKTSVVRDYFGGFYFHTFVDINYLKKIIRELKSRGYSFYDLKQEENYVSLKDVYIKSKDGKIDWHY
ncbi:MAG: polysaccharide deacetylase family protein, partial [Caloramator sp.]|nr:polysaccharide deacetylase family protein [Caloramator sp.]